MRRLVLIAAMTITGCEEYLVGPEITNALDDYEIEMPPEDPLVLESFVFVEDPDGDATTGRILVTEPSGATLDAGSVTVEGLLGMKLARVYLAVGLTNAVPGEYALEVFVTDREGFESNHVTTNVTVVDPVQ